ncbi:hypothetical protein F2Q69_00020021 [Brassica cretica]|uniref:Uncharacterized protein n=1 Tax=Brassica cretica TaxID=69181 RepID=A0A8S9QE87_BRACR|nr:hypothetical protein F2Q69_00020021 [Brassica cretica]
MDSIFTSVVLLTGRFITFKETPPRTKPHLRSFPALAFVNHAASKSIVATSHDLTDVSFYGGLTHRHVNRQSFFTVHHSVKSKSVNLVMAVHTAESSRNAVSLKDSVSPPGALKWTPES